MYPIFLARTGDPRWDHTITPSTYPS